MFRWRFALQTEGSTEGTGGPAAQVVDLFSSARPLLKRTVRERFGVGREGVGEGSRGRKLPAQEGKGARLVVGAGLAARACAGDCSVTQLEQPARPSGLGDTAGAAGETLGSKLGRAGHPGPRYAGASTRLDCFGHLPEQTEGVAKKTRARARVRARAPIHTHTESGRRHGRRRERKTERPRDGER